LRCDLVTGVQTCALPISNELSSIAKLTSGVPHVPECLRKLLRERLSFINFAAREINCKIVYYGAGLGGKTTNLQYIYQKTAEQQKGKMISLATETERTLFFDFLPLDLGSVRGFKTRIHLYTVPGQVFYDASRKLI